MKSNFPLRYFLEAFFFFFSFVLFCAGYLPLVTSSYVSPLWQSFSLLIFICVNFQVAADMLQVCRFTHLEMCDPIPYYELELDRKGSSNMNTYLDSCVQTVLREARKKFKNWTHVDTVGDVEVSCLKFLDGVPLRIWRGVVDIDASNTSVYLGLWSDR